MQSPWPLDSILDALFTVSPNKQYLGIVVPTTPAATGPKRLVVNKKIQKFQKQPPEVFFKKGAFRKFHRITPVLESPFYKVAGLQAQVFSYH